MSARAETRTTGFDTIKLVVAAVLLIAGIFGFYHFAAYSTLLRVLGLLVVAAGAAAVALQTEQGRRLWQFAGDARTEVRKVVWPTRQETMQTTLVVIVMVLILGIILWLFDLMLTGILRYLTGQGRLKMTQRWYVIHAYSGFEGQVKRSLEDRVKRAGMEDLFGPVLVPTEEVVEMRGGQQRKSERKFFPGYVLVKMDLTDDTWHLVKSVPKVMGFIGGTGDKPAPIPEAQAEAILQRVQEGVEKPRPKVLYEPGEVVWVVDGPFTDFNGVVEEVDYEKNRLKVSVLIFGRSTPVDLEFGQIEKG